MVGDRGVRLSGGQRQRIALARALATNGRLVILDEPTEGFDKDGTEMMSRVAGEFHRQGCTIIAFSHDPAAIKGADMLIDLNSKPVPRIGQMPRPVENPNPNDPAPATEATS